MAVTIQNTIVQKAIITKTSAPPLTVEFWFYNQISEFGNYGTVVTPNYIGPAWNSGSFIVDGGFSGAPLYLRVDAMLVDRLLLPPHTLSSSVLDTSFNGSYSFTDPDFVFAGPINFVNGVGIAEVSTAGFPANVTASIYSQPVPLLGFSVTRTQFWAYDGMTYEYFWAP